MKAKFLFWIIILIVGITSCIPNKPNNNLNFSLDLKEKDIQLAYEAGYREPVASNGTEEGRALNRRAEITLEAASCRE